MVIPLNYLKENQQAKIVWMALPAEKERFFQDLGFLPDTPITCRKSNPAGSMSAYEIQRRLIAIRTVDANGILVKCI